MGLAWGMGGLLTTIKILSCTYSQYALSLDHEEWARKQDDLKMRKLNFAGIIALACAVIPLEYATVNAEEMQNARCSFWINGNPLGTESCRTRWSNGRVTSINYLVVKHQGVETPKLYLLGKEDGFLEEMQNAYYLNQQDMRFARNELHGYDLPLE